MYGDWPSIRQICQYFLSPNFSAAYVVCISDNASAIISMVVKCMNVCLQELLYCIIRFEFKSQEDFKIISLENFQLLYMIPYLSE